MQETLWGKLNIRAALLDYLVKSMMFQDEAEAALPTLEQGPWDRKFPSVVAAWRHAFHHMIPFAAFPPAVRRLIDTTNAIESINSRLSRIIETPGHFPSDEAATKMNWPALHKITAD